LELDPHLEKFRQDKNNYRAGIFYNCPQDPCLILPKRLKPGWGWTINFGHRYALPFCAIGLLFSSAPLYIFLIYDLWWQPTYAMTPGSPAVNALILSTLAVSVIFILVLTKLNNRKL
jgi:hypothetical protein